MSAPARLRITGGAVHDPANGVDGEVRDICIEDGRIVERLPAGAPTLDARGMVVMPGGVDIHAHFASSSCNHARRLIPDEHAADPAPAPRLAGRRAARAVGDRRHGAEHVHHRLPLRGPRATRPPSTRPSPRSLARHSHSELDDTPVRRRRHLRPDGERRVPAPPDRGRRARPRARLRRLAAAVDRRLRDQDRESRRRRGLEVGSAERERARRPGRRPAGDAARDPRDAGRRGQRAPPAAPGPHPLQQPGRRRATAATTLASMEALAGRRAHFTHLQFHCYGGGSGQPWSSAAAKVIEYVNAHPEVSADVGQVMFGPAMTITADAPGRVPAAQEQRPPVDQHRHRAGDRLRHRAPDLQGQGGGERAAVGGRARAVPAERRIRGGSCSRPIIPNGGSFLSYPELIQLLMDRSRPRRAAQAGQSQAAGRAARWPTGSRASTR